MLSVITNPLFWLGMIFFCMFITSEWIPAIKAFRIEQIKHARTLDIKGHINAEKILCIGVPGIIISGFAFFISLLRMAEIQEGCYPSPIFYFVFGIPVVLTILVLAVYISQFYFPGWRNQVK